MSESKRSHKGLIYSILATIISISAILLICAVVFLILYKAKGFSMWIFGAGSEEILPILLTSSFLLTTVPIAFILMNEKKSLKKAMCITMTACVVVAGAYLTVSLITAPDNLYTINVSDNGENILVICESSKGDENEVILYRLFDDGFTMQNMSASKCIADGYRPFTSGNAEIVWKTNSFTVRVKDPQTNGYKQAVYPWPAD